MFTKGTKRKFSDPGEEPASSGDPGPAAPSAAARTLSSSYSLQRQSLLDMSLIKLQLCHMLVEPNLCRSVLIANTVRQIQEEMTQDGTWHIMTQALAAAQCPADRLVATEVLCRQTDAAAQAGQSPKPFSVVGLQEGYHSEEVVMEGDVETEVTMSSLSPLSPQLSSASYLTGPFEMGPCWEEEDEEEEEGKTPCEKQISKGSLSRGSSASLPAQTGSRENMPMLNTKIFFPGSLTSSSIISRLLVNADPFSCDADNMDCYTEKCVMNNYFGIGLDAKISLDFNNKRDEHPEKCRSRTKNMMWYGVLGTRELLHRTYKNLEQRVLLECDGRPIPLPRLQGIAVLNIPSYAGGTNFWGGTKEDDTFAAPSFDDKILEVVAVFGSMQMAVSRVINLQHHRIAQCRTVKITILGDEGVPVQVDGEAWIQPPGYIKIIHKNRTQTLTRDRAFENTLKSWEDKQKCEFPRSQPAQSSQPETVSEEESSRISELGQAAGALILSIREVAQSHHSMEQELAHAVNASSKAMDVVYAKSPGALTCSSVVQMVSNVRALLSETELLLAGKMSMQLDPPQQEQLNAALGSVAQQLRRLSDVPWLCLVIDPLDHEGPLMDFSKRSRSGKFRLVPKFKKDKNIKNKEMSSTLSLPVDQWGTEEVGAWLDFLCLSEYKDIFTGHDVRGAELIHLERRDLKDLGVTKVGHMKRILQGIRELTRTSSASEV
uniref:Diacylglycerol kinase, delta 130kDa n=1 Tax=Nothobranchius kuhntae TaxID=321403 RepID=A0A1A8JID6_NOTKU